MTTHRRTILRMIAAARSRPDSRGPKPRRRQAHQHAQAAQAAAKQTGTPFKPKFFTPHEYATVRMLVDIIIPKDERSGSATDAGVPEFMDFIMIDEPGRQLAMRGGLAWLDRECQNRFDKTFLDVHRKPSAPQVLDDDRVAAAGRPRRCRTASRSSTASAI